MHEINRTLSNQTHRHKINLGTILTTNKIILSPEVLSSLKPIVTLTYRQMNDLQLWIRVLTILIVTGVSQCLEFH